MKFIETQIYKSPIGELVLGSFDNQLCLLDFRYRKMRQTVDARLQKGLDAKFTPGSNDVLNETEKQLKRYFKGSRRTFDLPILTVGSDFQKSVWKALLSIEYGKTASYLEIAKLINNEKAVRAVANANGANSIGIIIPCHRIIGADGTLVGYGGGLNVKRKLLELESSTINQGKLL